MVKEGVRDDRGVGGKEPEVDGNVTGRHVGGTVSLVHLLIKDTSIISDVEDVVRLAESVKGSVPTDVISS